MPVAVMIGNVAPSPHHLSILNAAYTRTFLINYQDNMTRILVIGGTGAQGFAVLQALLTAGYSIRVLSRNPDSPDRKSTRLNSSH